MERIGIANPHLMAKTPPAPRVQAPVVTDASPATAGDRVDAASLPPVPAAEAVHEAETVSTRSWVGAAALGVIALSGLAAPTPLQAAAPLISHTLSISQRVEAEPGSKLSAPGLQTDSLSRGARAERSVDTIATRSGVSPFRTSEPNPLPALSPISPSPTGWRFEFETQNDSYPTFLGLTPDRFLTPGRRWTDDDGFTAGFGTTLTRTSGDRQTVLQTRYDLVTEKGGWPPYSATYGARRTDVLDVAVQQNFRTSLDDRTQVYAGAGVGLQAVGPMSGRDIQLWWHQHGIEGRVGDALQSNYTTRGVSVTPMLTGGVGVRHQLDSAGDYHLIGSLEANAPLGAGLGAVRAKAGVQARPTSWMSLEGGVTATGAWSTHPAMDFHSTSGVRPGMWASATFNTKGAVSPYVWVETGGVRGEPQYGIGFSIRLGGGGGSTSTASDPWLRPTWR